MNPTQDNPTFITIASPLDWVGSLEMPWPHTTIDKIDTINRCMDGFVQPAHATVCTLHIMTGHLAQLRQHLVHLGLLLWICRRVVCRWWVVRMHSHTHTWTHSAAPVALSTPFFPHSSEAAKGGLYKCGFWDSPLLIRFLFGFFGGGQGRFQFSSAISSWGVRWVAQVLPASPAQLWFWRFSRIARFLRDTARRCNIFVAYQVHPKVPQGSTAAKPCKRRYFRRFGVFYCLWQLLGGHLAVISWRCFDGHDGFDGFHFFLCPYDSDASDDPPS